jgi:resuscitation-promoting factor RpfA
MGAAPVGAAAAAHQSATVRHAAVSRHSAASHRKAARVMNHKLRKLRTCESGDRYHINTHNGYYGAYQFAKSTWHGLGYHGLPSHAKAKTQDAAAKKLHAKQGWHPWPVCSKKEHL